jgi:2-hydroxychromene-2-carboxylate isomerase
MPLTPRRHPEAPRGLLLPCAFACLALAGPGCGPGAAPPPKEPAPPPDAAAAASAVKVELFTMSKCPYGAEMQVVMKALLDEMGDAVDFEQVFIMADEGDGDFYAMHGEGEVEGNAVQLCAAALYGKDNAYMDFVSCMAVDVDDVPGNWTGCAKTRGLDVEAIEACAGGKKGAALLAQSAKVVEEKKILGSPTLVVDGTAYPGGRSLGEARKIVCCALEKEDRPATCESIVGKCPGKGPLSVTVITDARCESCKELVANAVMKLLMLFPKLDAAILDFGDEEGRALYDAVGGGYLPLFVFGEAVRDEPEFSQVEEWAVASGDKVVLKPGRIFHPLEEACGNGRDDNGDGKADCEDAACTESLGCRKEIPASLDLFVMSLCPFGREAEGAVAKLLAVVKKAVAFNLHFIVDVYSADEFEGLPPAYREGCAKKSDGNVYCALHGEEELAENIIQACARRHGGEKNAYVDFILCRNGEISDPDWAGCAGKNGLDVDTLRACAEGDEGLALIRKDAELAAGMSIGASPTFIVNNTALVEVDDLTMEDIAFEFCALNAKLKACKKLGLNTTSSKKKGETNEEGEEPSTCGE